jgi:hypothetical protein
MFRRIEDRIRSLSKELTSAHEDREITVLLSELRLALHQHVTQLRTRMGAYPVMADRRRNSHREERSGSAVVDAESR